MNSETSGPKQRPSLPTAVLRWVDADAGVDSHKQWGTGRHVDWVRILPLIGMHLACGAVIWTGWSPTALTAAIILYLVRMFAITGFYHRYFSHKTFTTRRFWQFLFAVIGNASVQRGPLWWAGHHRHHHRHADTPEDTHSPVQHGFWWSHIGWLTSRAHFPTPHSYVRDWRHFPELVWLNRFDIAVPVALAVILFAAGEALARWAPSLETNGIQLFIWGFCISTVALLHATCCINSLTHLFGRRRFDTPDNSRNNALTAIITLGEGWHNNHHHYAVSARQGFRWYELDITYYLLRLMAAVGIIQNLRPIPEDVRRSSDA